MGFRSSSSLVEPRALFGQLEVISTVESIVQIDKWQIAACLVKINLWVRQWLILTFIWCSTAIACHWRCIVIHILIEIAWQVWNRLSLWILQGKWCEVSVNLICYLKTRSVCIGPERINAHVGATMGQYLTCRDNAKNNRDLARISFKDILLYFQYFLLKKKHT